MTCLVKRERMLYKCDEHWILAEPSIPFRSIRDMTSCIAQFTFFFYRPKPIRVDFSGGQISSDAGLLPLRAFDQRHGLTRDLAQRISDEERVQHSVLSLLRQRLYQIVAGYEDASCVDLLRLSFY